MPNSQNRKPVYDLEERTFLFAKDVRLFTKTIPNSISNIEDSKQLIRASGSVGANYIEANESLSKKDFLFRIKISKEVKECRYWLRLLIETNPLKDDSEGNRLYKESVELLKIFSSIIEKSQ